MRAQVSGVTFSFFNSPARLRQVMIITEDNRGNFSIPVIISLLFVGVILKYLLVQNNSSLVLADTLGLDH